MMTAMKRNRRAARRGTALMEFVLFLPLLMFILVLVVFFGQSMRRMQNVVVADRHYAWRFAKRIDLPMDQAGNVDMEHIRTNHFPIEMTDVTPSLSAGHNTPRDAAEGMISEAAVRNTKAGEFAEDVVDDLLPRGQSMHVSAVYRRDTLPMDRYFANEMDTRYFREGVPWQHRDIPQDRDNASYWDEVRDHYISDFDRQMQRSNDTQGLVARIRNLYLRHW